VKKTFQFEKIIKGFEAEILLVCGLELEEVLVFVSAL
jgi:hypothetical protein